MLPLPADGSSRLMRVSFKIIFIKFASLEFLVTKF